jgi:hypothetical protein
MTSPWWWREYAPLKRRSTATGLHRAVISKSWIPVTGTPAVSERFLTWCPKRFDALQLILMNEVPATESWQYNRCICCVEISLRYQNLGYCLSYFAGWCNCSSSFIWLLSSSFALRTVGDCETSVRFPVSNVSPEECHIRFATVFDFFLFSLTLCLLSSICTNWLWSSLLCSVATEVNTFV